MVDSNLVERARDGDPEAFEALVEIHSGAIRALAYQYVRDFDAALDIAQDTLIDAYLGLPSLRDPSRFRPWLRRIAQNVCRMWLRRRRSVRSLQDVMGSDEEPRTATDPETLLRRLAVEQALDRLPEAARFVVTLHYFSGYSQREVAEFLEVPVTTVKNRLRSARSRLRRDMIATLQVSRKEEAMPEDLPADVLRKALERAEALRESGRLEEARAEASRAWDIDPSDPEVFRLLVETGEFDGEADAVADTFRPLPSDADVALTGDLRDLSRRLRVSPVTVYRWLREGMPCYDVGEGSIRFSLAESLRWLAKRGLEPAPRAPGWISDDILLAVLHAAGAGEITPREGEEIVERFHTREWMRVVEAGGRLVNLREIAELLPEPAGRIVESITRRHVSMAKRHVEIRRRWSPCENFEVPDEREGLWELLAGIAEEAEGLAGEFRELMARRPGPGGPVAPGVSSEGVDSPPYPT